MENFPGIVEIPQCSIHDAGEATGPTLIGLRSCQSLPFGVPRMVGTEIWGDMGSCCLHAKAL